MLEARSWKRLAQESLIAAKALYEDNFYRACVNRTYYASYQAATAESVSHGDAGSFPTGWNNPSHEQLPGLILNNGGLTLPQRRSIAHSLRFLRNAREDADYRPGHTVDQNVARDCLREAASVLRVLGVQNE